LHDVGVIAISSPTGVLDSGITITPACTVYNFGGTTENYTVRMKIGTFYDQTATVSNHQPLTKIYLTFPVWNANQLGTHLVSCSTRLSNDMVLSNDRQTGSVEVRRIGIKDVGCTKILMPTGIIDSGMVITPACSVYNYGNTVETYTVRMKIGIDYNYTATVINHTPLTYRYLTFPNWFASPRGKIAVTCTTELSGDNQPGNDKKIDSVFVQVLDVSPIEILAPIDTIDLGSVITPQIKVKNFGNTPVSFNTFLLIGDYAAEMVVSELLPDEERIISFSDWTAEPAGEISVKCTTQLFGDQRQENDKIIGSVYVRVLDVGVIEILAPSDTVDSGMAMTPKAKIKNFGSEPASFGVIFQISDYYSMREISSLSPDLETIIDFDLWLPEKVGDFLAQCSTMLNGDVQPENDCQRKIVNVRPKIPTTAWVKVSDLPLAPSNKRIKSGGLIVSGGNKIYIVKGNNTKDFYSFIPENAITQLDSVPIAGKKGVKKGTGMVYDGTKYLYFASGTNTLQFWRYDTETNAWESLPPIPAGGGKALKGGTGMAYVNGFVYLLKGSKTNEFYAFDCTNNTWIETLPKAPEGTYIGKGYSDGSCLIAYDDNTLYALRGKYNEFYKYDISANTWEKDSGMPFTHPMWNKKKKVGEGAAMTLKSGKIYAFKGNNTKEFWSFDPTTKWAGLETIPKMPDKKYVKGGGGLCTWTDGTIYALKGNNTLSIWKYTGEDLTLALPSSNIGTQELSRKTFIQINSNPTKGLTKVYYNLPKKEVAILKVYNTLGNLVYSAKSDKGEFTIKKLPAGIYLLRFESASGGYKEDRKLIVVK
ncbi:MAG: T9SS type A sorting domain-containing protein, partial [candidate division WOR-3 bacterium]